MLTALLAFRRGASLVLPRLGRGAGLLLLAFVAANAVLSVTDQVGALDVVTLAAGIGTLVLLMLLRRDQKRTP